MSNHRQTAEERKERIFVWARFTIGIAVGLVLAVLIAGYIIRDNQIADCVRDSEFKVIEARAWEAAARARRADGNIATADEYALTARQIRATIPVRPRDKSLPRGDVPSNRARGCEASYPPPIPFVE